MFWQKRAIRLRLGCAGTPGDIYIFASLSAEREADDFLSPTALNQLAPEILFATAGDAESLFHQIPVSEHRGTHTLCRV
jgi:hypothetical protein